MKTLDSSGDRIRRSRKEANLTQKQVADAVGVSGAAVAQWETGDTKALKPEHLFKLARLLNKNAEWLATGRGPEHDGSLLSDVLQDVGEEYGQGILDFIQYRVERAHELITSDRLAHYLEMIESIRADLALRKRGQK